MDFMLTIVICGCGMFCLGTLIVQVWADINYIAAKSSQPFRKVVLIPSDSGNPDHRLVFESVASNQAHNH